MRSLFRGLRYSSVSTRAYAQAEGRLLPDLNADAKFDILSNNPVNGQTDDWMMDGTSAISGDSLLAHQRRWQHASHRLQRIDLTDRDLDHAQTTATGPGVPAFPTQLEGDRYFQVSASYTLRFTVSDGTLSTNDDVIIRVAAPRAFDGTDSRILAVVANVSDGVAVVGIQIKLDDTNMGSELTSSPSSMMWNTTTASDPCHTLSAIPKRCRKSGNHSASSYG